MYLKVKVWSHNKDKTKCSNRCVFLKSGITYCYCDQFGLLERNQWDSVYRSKKCINAEIKIDKKKKVE